MELAKIFQTSTPAIARQGLQDKAVRVSITRIDMMWKRPSNFFHIKFDFYLIFFLTLVNHAYMTIAWKFQILSCLFCQSIASLFLFSVNSVLYLQPKITAFTTHVKIMEHVIVIPKTTLVRVLQITLEKAVKVCCLGSFLKKPILQNLSYVK